MIAIGTASNKPGLKVFHKGLILVGTPFVIELILICSLAVLLQASDKQSIREVRYRRCAAICAKLVTLTNELMTCMYSYYQSGDDVFLKTFDSDYKKIAERIVLLQEVARGDELAIELARTVKQRRDELFPSLNKLMEPARQGKGILDAAALYNNMKAEMSRKSDQNMQKMAEVTRLQEKIADEAGKRRLKLEAQQKVVLLAGLIANVIAGLSLLLFYKSSISQRLQIIRQNTVNLAEQKPLLKAISGADEISQLDQAFHQMDNDLQEASAREKSLFENAGDLICSLDRNLKFLKVNPASKKLWGYEPQQLIGQPLHSIILAEDKARASQTFQKAIDGDEVQALELRVMAADTNTSYTLWTSYFAQDENQLYCVAHEISERKKIEALKQSFLAMMSSDLQQPLIKIAENVKKLLGDLKEQLSDKAIDKLILVEGNLNRLIGLVSELLELAQSSENQVSEKELCSTEELLNNAALELQELCSRAKIGFKVECHASTCFANQNKIMQVLVNLGSNAIKFSPAGSQVCLTAKTSGDFVEIQVQDQGRGVPDCHKDAIFEKFKQVSQADGKRKSGTGLGLPICKDIIEDHHGKIGVRDNESESGSRFWFTLPQTQEQYKALHAESLNQTESRKNKNLEAPKNVLPPVSTRGPLLPSRLPSGQLKLTQKGLLLIGIPILFEIAFVLSLQAVLHQTEKYSAQELRWRQLAATANRLMDGYYTASLLVVRYKSIENWNKFDEGCELIIQQGKQLKNLCTGDRTTEADWRGVEKIHLMMLKRIHETRLALGDGKYTKELANEKMPERFELWAISMAISKRLSKLIDDAEHKEFINPEKQMRLRQQQTILLTFALAANALICFAMALFFSKDISARLSLQADNALRLARLLPLNPPLAGVDEIANLDLAFHATAEKVAAARRKERAIFENSKDLIFALNIEGMILSSNQATERLLQFDKGTAVSIFDLMNSEEAEALKRTLSENIESGKQVELELNCTDSTKYILLNLTKPQDQNNVYCVGHDITHKKELEQLKQGFLAVVSHDLRTPLTSINLAASLVEAGASGPLGKDALLLVREIMKQADNLIELINDLLDLEKLEAKQMDLARSDFNSDVFLSKIIESAELRYDELDIEESRKEQAVLYGDEERLSHSINSILSFAVQNKERSAALHVKTARNNATLKIQLVVASTIDARQAMSRFNRFDLEQHSKPAPHLSVLALALASAIISAHSGQLQISGPARELCYEIALPIKSQ